MLAALLLCLTACGTKRYAVQSTPVLPATQTTDSALAADNGAEADKAGEDAEDSANVHHNLAVKPADQHSWLGYVQHRIDSLCHSVISETSQLGILIYDLTDNQPIYALNPQHRMRPASCMKLVTCITLLDRMSGSQSLCTEVRATGQLADGVLNGDLYLTGDMDPMLSRENLDSLACALRQAGIDSVAGRICELMPPYEVPTYGWGWCWDDDYGPLAAHLVDGAEGILAAWPEALSKAGIRLNTSMMAEVSGQEGETIVAFAIEHPIAQVMEPLLKKSDNIYAECLFHRLAAMSSHKKTARHQAAAVVDSLITRLGLEPKDYLIADGSGLSLYNYVTPELLVTLLNHAQHNEQIRQYLLPCLPIAGVDGTLKKRMTGTRAQGNVLAKTGTVEGVSSLSGYLTAANGHLISFSIINQGIVRTRTGHNFQDQVCLILCE